MEPDEEEIGHTVGQTNEQPDIPEIEAETDEGPATETDNDAEVKADIEDDMQHAGEDDVLNPNAEGEEYGEGVEPIADEGDPDPVTE